MLTRRKREEGGELRYYVRNVLDNKKSLIYHQKKKKREREKKGEKTKHAKLREHSLG